MARRAFRFCSLRHLLLGGAALSLLSGLAVAQQIQANVEFSNLSQTDPHPITYSYDGPTDPIKEGTATSATYYHAFYTGVVNPDARVPKDEQVGRVFIPLEQWETNRQWVISKLTLYYQLTHNLSPASSLRQLAGEPEPTPTPTPEPTNQDQYGGMDENGNPLPEGESGNGAGGTGTPGMASPNMMMPPPGGMMPGAPGGAAPMMMAPMAPMGAPGANAQAMTAGGEASATSMVFDPKAAAEWTFYYDQLVLWQYYCARNLLNGMDDELLEKQESSASETQTADGTSPELGGTNQKKQVSMLDLAMGIQPGNTGQETLQIMKQQTNRSNQNGTGGAGMGAMPTAPGGLSMPMPGYMGMPGGGGGGMGTMGPMGGMGMGMGGGAGMETASAREIFYPMEDYAKPERATEAYRTRFEQAAQRKDEKLHEEFMAMIGRIDKRSEDQEQFRQARANQQQQVQEFAQNWRNVQKGDTFMMGDNLYLATEKPLDALPLNSVNIVKKDRLTPQDLLNEDGTLKQPKVE